MRISIFNFWYKCPYCDKEHSISQSYALEYNQKIKCICGHIWQIKGLKGEIEVELSK